MWRVVARYRGFAYFSLTVGPLKHDAVAYDGTLKKLATHQRYDVFEALAGDEVAMSEVHRAVSVEGAASMDLARLGVGSGDQPLGGLYDAWMAHIRDPASVSPRTHRPYSASTLERYGEGWENFFRHHPLHRLAPPASLTNSALAAFRSLRIKVDRVEEACVNRDLTAIQSFLRWLRDEKPNALPRPPRIVKFRERDYSQDDRHLEPEQWAQLRRHLPESWRPFFELLVHTGLRIGEAEALVRSDLRTESVQVRKGKTPKARRSVPVAPVLLPMITGILRSPGKPFDFVFDERMSTHELAYHVFLDTCIAAGLHDRGEAAMLEHREALEEWKQSNKKQKKGVKSPPAPEAPDPLPVQALFSPHSLRHSFGVSAARGNLSLLEIRDLLGHSTTGVTERYAKFRPNQDLRREQVAKIAAAFAQKMPVLDPITPSIPQTPPPERHRKTRMVKRVERKTNPPS